MRVLVDSNVFASAAIGFRRPTSKPAAVFRGWQSGAFEVLVCPVILRELPTIQQRPFFTTPTIASDLAELVQVVTELAEVVSDSPLIDVELPDPKDVAILSAAYHGRADFLVTGDDDLLGVTDSIVPIVNPATFLALLERS